MSESNATEKIRQLKNSRRDPSPWIALYLDSSTPMGENAKANILLDISSKSRQFFLPLIRPFCRLMICITKILKTFLPNAIQSSWLLHQTIYLGLRYFVSPHANYLIMRHFSIGSQLLEFVAVNAREIDMELNPLRPKKLADLKDNVFLDHDLNIYNFIIALNRQLNEKGIQLEPNDQLDYSCIHDDFGIEKMPKGWFNIIDLETAIEIYTPMYQLFLTDSDFWRACNSLQLDETIAVYATSIIKDQRFLGLVNNRHPIIPESCLSAGHRLMLHGLAAESLHGFIMKRKQAQTSANETSQS